MTTQDLTAWRTLGKTPAAIRPQILPPRVLDTIALVAMRHSTTVADIIGRSRFREHCRARAEAAYWLRKMEWFGDRPSLPLIGRWLQRDHTTVLWAIRRHEERVVLAAATASNPPR